jgi:hypothetical protein
MSTLVNTFMQKLLLVVIKVVPLKNPFKFSQLSFPSVFFNSNVDSSFPYKIIIGIDPGALALHFLIDKNLPNKGFIF